MTTRLVVCHLLLTLFLTTSVVMAEPDQDRTQPRPSLEKVAIDPALVDVSDGDTVVINWGPEDRERVRILGIDTPEIAHPRYGMPYHQPFGLEATAFAQGAFAAAESITLLRAAETDPYGRTLGYFFLNDRNYSELAVKAGYAVETVTHYGDNGFPEIAEAVLAISRQVAPVPFEPPFQFRRRMREIEDWAESAAEKAAAEK
jgi:micrococcal nuclease